MKKRIKTTSTSSNITALYVDPMSATLLEEFTYNFAVRITQSDSPEQHAFNGDATAVSSDPERVTAEYKPGLLGGTVAGELLVHGVRKDLPGEDPVVVTLTTDTTPAAQCQVFLRVMESDMLVVAPTGSVYRVPPAVWMQGTALGEEYQTVEYNFEALPQGVRAMVQNDTVAANIPNEPRDGASGEGEATAKRKSRRKHGTQFDPGEPVTCFLLNLRSIAMSSMPNTPRTPIQISWQPGGLKRLGGKTKGGARKTR
ncbi:hypothetical protein P2318_26270 [Myxococcaceae bacterium GXIMD 01537]